jgi:4-hydroxy-4-methyl-2-oxoglutarate aldolase
LVTDAAVRDTADLRAMGFPVWTRHISVQGTVKATPGSVNVPITIGGIIITPGDVICADDDGVVLVNRAEADWALERALARVGNEQATRSKLEAGELGVDFYGLRPKLVELGVEYIDRI